MNQVELMDKKLIMPQCVLEEKKEAFDDDAMNAMEVDDKKKSSGKNERLLS